MEFKKYDVVYGEFAIEEDGSIQAGYRPAVVIQNDIGNKYSPTLLVLPLSRKLKKMNMPTHMPIDPNEENGLREVSTLLAEQVTPANKNKVTKIGIITNRLLQKQIFRCFVYAAAYGKNDPDFLELQFN